MQLFTHLLSSYLQGMGDFFSALPKGGRSCQLSKTQQEWTPAPWGGSGRGPFKAAVFVPAPAGLFLPPTAAFFTVVTAGVMQCMTAVLVPMPRRKTCFPTGIRDSTAKAKPPAVATAFCVYFIPCGDEQINAHSGRPAISSNSVGVAISQPRVAGEARYPGYI